MCIRDRLRKPQAPVAPSAVGRWLQTGFGADRPELRDQERLRQSERLHTGKHQAFSDRLLPGLVPIIPRPEAHDLPRRLKTLCNQAQRPWLHATLNIGQKDLQPGERQGLTASGMFVVNPPHPLKAQLSETLPVVLAHLGRGRGRSHSVESGG